MLGIQNAREWERFCRDVLQRPELAADPAFSSNPARVRHRPALKTAIEDVFRSLTADQVIARLEHAHIAYARARSVADLADHPQLSARDRWRTVESPVGPIRALLPPVQLDAADPVMGSIPSVGQHTDAILSELGFDASTIAAWRTEGVI
jgi:itaconate CoA-transferase